ncbi:hypothetical protein BDV93DRAFT_515262 [Ceratobasidium sp. AG-I]|nr:hypothetical protein BDV93DRAFT_515262 [Ceratobasidium sp. AG-I]
MTLGSWDLWICWFHVLDTIAVPLQSQPLLTLPPPSINQQGLSSLVRSAKTFPTVPSAAPSLPAADKAVHSPTPSLALSPSTGATGGTAPLLPVRLLPPTTPLLPTARPRFRRSNSQLAAEAAQNRLSFISNYNFLTLAPLASVPLGAITSGQDAPGDPPGAVGMHCYRSSVSGGGLGAVEGKGRDEGGKFNREGLGRGLKERLETTLN